MDVNGKMLLGTDITAALAILEGLGVDVLGLNCSTGPDHMRPAIEYLSEHSSLPVSCVPNAGLPMNIDGEAVYPMAAGPFSEILTSYVSDYGVRVVGGCCGTTPEHIRQLTERLGKIKPVLHGNVPFAALSSSIGAVPLEQEPRPFLIGERMNAQGSKAFKRLLLADDFDGMLQIAHDQVENGAHALDISVAVTERGGEANTLRRLVKRLSLEVPVPLVIDSTEQEVIEAALETAPGRCLINSTNLESGDAKARKIFALARKFGAAVLCLTIDEQGMARSAERKLAVAQRMAKLAESEYGLHPQDLVFDDLTFTLATGDEAYRDSALQTLQGIRLIKQALPGSHTSLGISNVSFGLPPASRKVVNSVFLFHATKAGLDMAIVNPAQIKPYAEISETERALAEALIFNKSESALADLIFYYESHSEKEQDTTRADPFEGLTPAERLHKRILIRQKNGVEDDIDAILAEASESQRDRQAVWILNEVLLPAMKEVGDRFGSGELILPFVLQSAEVMKSSVAYLEKFLNKNAGSSRGKLVLATVYGDVHDIGKNLVKTILSNNGYEVIDLGKQVPAEKIISTAVAEHATAIGLSALLVSTSQQMPRIVEELKQRDLEIPVLIGGAAINPRFAWHILRDQAGQYYEPGVFYCKDAFEGLAVMDALTDPQKRPALIAETRHKAEMEYTAEQMQKIQPTLGEVSGVKPADFIPVAPSWGPRVVEKLPLQSVAEKLNLNTLYRFSWGAKHTRGEAWEALKAEFDARRLSMLAEAEKSGWLQPQAVYGYWPAQADDESLVIYDPSESGLAERRELVRLSCPRQRSGKRLSLADYFLPVGSKRFDVAALQVVTVGAGASRYFDELDKSGRYTEAYFVHGLAVQMAEACAEYLHEHIRSELGLKPGQGLRYSWGYPSIPDLSDHRKVFDLLPAESALGMSLTASFQLVPEESTAALIIHHPDAQYFSTGVSRLEQLLG